MNNNRPFSSLLLTRTSDLVIAVCLLIAFSVNGYAQDGLLQRARLSVVKITVTGNGPDGKGRRENGTGFFIDRVGNILTSAHVVGTPTEWQVDPNTDRIVRTIDVYGLDQNDRQISYTSAQSAIVVYIDTQSDLALLRVMGRNFRPLRFGDSLEITGTDNLDAIGYATRPAPVRLPATVLLPFDPQVAGGYMRLRVGVEAGDSGAPVLNSRGDVVGVVTGGTVVRPVANEAFATPSHLAANVIRLTGGKVDDVPVGTIVASLLEPAVFFQQYDPDYWTPADGRPIDKNSRYAVLTKSEHLPDLRGMFLRGLNTFDQAKGPRSDGKEDLDGSNRRAGDPQDQRVAGHTHPIGTGATDVTNNQMTPASRRIPTYINDVFSNPPALSTGSNDTSGENRPKNVGVYYYVKIN
jgi:hypothetical protein